MIKDAKKRGRRCGAVLLMWLVCLLLAVAFASPARAEEDGYYYPNYDAAANGCVDLMRYVKRVTVTVNGTDYTTDQLAQMRASGNPLRQKIGDQISFNFRFSLNGRAYQSSDETQLDRDASTWVTYSHGTTYLNGESVAAGQQGILDDSSLMASNTAKGGSFLRMDIGWLLDIGPGNYTIEYTDGKVSFYQGSGESSRYLYVYFPGGMASGDYYATDGYFTITTTWSSQVKTVHVPAQKGYYVPDIDGWDFCVEEDTLSQDYSGTIDTYGEIKVVKRWVTNEAHGPATIVLEYRENGVAKTATRKLTEDASTATFTIQRGMTDCVLHEDMTGLENYSSQMEVSADGRTYTFTNTLGKPVQFSKKSVTSADELPGAKLELYGVWNDGTESLIDRWTSGDTPHTVTLYPASYRLHETAAPAGYGVSTDIAFTVKSDYSVQVTSTEGSAEGDTLTITNKPLAVKLAKVDEKDNPLAGAELQLTDKTTGEVVDRWTSGSAPREIAYKTQSGIVLVAGHTYELAEITAPAGYRVAEPISFVFNGDGTIPGCPYHTVTMKDQPEAMSTPTPAPSATPGPAPTPGPGGGNPGGGRTTVKGVQTGDSPRMWVFLALGLGCMAGSLFLAWLGFWGDESRRIYKWR